MAIDSLEWLKCLFALMIWPNQRPDNEEIMRWLGESPCITDARALYDASVSKAPGMKLAEKRTAIEIKMSCERMAAAAGVLNSHQQLADGMTKTSARIKLAQELKRRMHSLLYDPLGVASKKVKKEEKQDEQDLLDKAAQDFENKKKIENGIFTLVDLDEEQLEECRLCLLPGCGLATEEGKKYCSKRHYHAHQHKKQTAVKSHELSASEGLVWGMTLALSPAHRGLHDHRNPGVQHHPDLWHPDCLPHWHATWTSRSTTATPSSSLYRPRMARMAKLARMARSWRSLSGTRTRGSNRSKRRT